ncbi:MAG: carboxypeptidase regulatory-like domain-containing protein [Deltaproteobacteria bacterium]|nr:carboxypeptidase regulatory-like domain-containing protein [Deltaproteobacteria bacterium]
MTARTAILAAALLLPGAARAGSERVSVQLRVLDARTGEPLPGARACAPGGGPRVRIDASGEPGTLSFSLPPGAEALALELSAPRHQPLRMQIRASAGQRQVLPVRLEPAAVLSGQVVGLAGTVLPGADVRLVHFPFWCVAEPRAETAADGRFELDSLGPGRHALRVSRPGYVPREQTVKLPARGCVQVTLQAALPIEIRVVDRAGRPIPGARIAYVGSDRSHYADEQGVLRAEDLPAGRHVLEVSAQGHLQSPPIELRLPAPGPVRIELSDGPVATGQVLDDRGLPFPGIFVLSSCGQDRARTGQDGRFRLALEEASGCRGNAHAEDDPIGVDFDLQPGQPVSVVVPRPALAEGRLTLAGRPVTRFTLNYGSVDAPDGRFAVRIWSREERLRFSGRFAPFSLTVQSRPGERVQLGELRAQPESSIEIDLDAPAPGRLSLLRRGSGDRLWPSGSLAVAGTGRYRFTGLGGGAFALFGGGDGWALEPAALAVRPGAEAGLEARAVLGAPVRLLCRWEGPFTLWNESQRFELHTSPSGSFELDGLPAGEWMVSAGYCPQQAIRVAPGPPIYVDWRPPSAALSVELDAPGPGRLTVYTPGARGLLWAARSIEVRGAGEWAIEKLGELPSWLLGGGEGWALEPLEVRPVRDRTISVEARAVPGAPLRIECPGYEPFTVSQGERRLGFSFLGDRFRFDGLPAGSWRFTGMPCPDAAVQVKSGAEQRIEWQLRGSKRSR